VSKAEELCLCPSPISEAREMSLKFKSLFHLFAYDSADQLDDENIDKLG